MASNGAEYHHGSCICGSVTFSLTGPPTKTLRCYCTDCVKSAGASHQVMAAYASSSITTKDPYGWIRKYTITKTDSGYPKEKHFCCKCGCTLWTMSMKYEGQVKMVKIALVEDGLKNPVFTPVRDMFATGHAP